VTSAAPTRLLFVCLGNICRSPTAEAVMRRLVSERGLDGEIEVDSAGTGDWHVGSPPDARAAEAAARRGFTLAGAARQVTRSDFTAFDLILAMDARNASDLRRSAPPGTAHKVRLLADVDVPDPYFGGRDGFDEVLDLVTDACGRLLDQLAANGRLRQA
jgi:protein-tyrosine phosphatase